MSPIMFDTKTAENFALKFKNITSTCCPSDRQDSNMPKMF